MGLFSRKKLKQKKLVEKHATNLKPNKNTNNEKLDLNKAHIVNDIQKLNKKYQKLNEPYWEELKQILISADISINIVLDILLTAKNTIKKNQQDKEAIINILKEAITKKYNFNFKSHMINFEPSKLNVFLFVGVNGVGKTTSIAKIANYYLKENQKILLVAGDTFRAGAVEQLNIWAKKINVDIHKPFKNNQDPASVVYQALQKAQSKNYDLVLIDTAGRLHNKINLMNELNKIKKSIIKFQPSAPQETFLVIDSITGKNGLNQAKVFTELIKISGIILTKADSTAKGGIILSIKNDLNLPVKFLGSGEKLTDLSNFNIDEYVNNLFI